MKVMARNSVARFLRLNEQLINLDIEGSRSWNLIFYLSFSNSEIHIRAFAYNNIFENSFARTSVIIQSLWYRECGKLVHDSIFPAAYVQGADNLFEPGMLMRTHVQCLPWRAITLIHRTVRFFPIYTHIPLHWIYISPFFIGNSRVGKRRRNLQESVYPSTSPISLPVKFSE